jgi:hypothetical protein
VWAPQADMVVDTLRQWLEHPGTLAQISDNSRRLGRPLASQSIARIIGQQIGLVETVPQEADLLDIPLH